MELGSTSVASNGTFYVHCAIHQSESIVHRPTFDKISPQIRATYASGIKNRDANECTPMGDV
jgi:hypothetical protein